LAESAVRALGSLQPNSDTVEIRVGERSAIIPTPVFHALLKVLQLLSIDRGVCIDPVDDEVTTEMAARRLGVSRPHLVNLLEKGEIPYRKVGSRRRIHASDLSAYLEAREAHTQEASRRLDKLLAEMRSK
jgi:excisionase family DNA binding protein